MTNTYTFPEIIANNYDEVSRSELKYYFDEDKIYDNAKTFIDTILKAKPQTLKGTYLKKISIFLFLPLLIL